MATPNNSLPDQERLGQDLTDIEGEIAALRARFDQYFMGIEKKNPQKDCEALKKRLLHVKGQFIRNTGLKFRVQSVFSKFQSYERLWQKTLKQIEEGTYKIDLQRLKRKNQGKGKTEQAPQTAKAKEAPEKRLAFEELEADLPEELFEEPIPKAPPPLASTASAAKPLVPASPTQAPPPAPRQQTAAPQATALPATARQPTPPPPPKPNPQAPAARVAGPASPEAGRTNPAPVAARPAPKPTATQPQARPPPPPPGANGNGHGPDLPISQDKLKQLYSAFITARKRCKESTDGITMDAVAQSLKKQVPQLMKEHGAKSVEFKVVIKDGKAVLKDVPKQ